MPQARRRLSRQRLNGAGSGRNTAAQPTDYQGFGPGMTSSDSSGPSTRPPASGNALAGPDAADRLQGIIERSGGWPIWQADRVGGLTTGTFAQMGKYGQSLREIALWQAIRENDRAAIIDLSGWEKDRPLHLDPIGEDISSAYANMLFGEEPDFYAADDSDQDVMDEMAKESGLADELKRYCDMAVSEGECWWRCWTDPEASDWPLIAGHSRLNVVPLFVGRRIAAVAFVDNLLNQDIKVENQVTILFWRHVEIHTVGYVRNLLYRGSLGSLGTTVPLNMLEETAHLEEDWYHNLPIMLAGRIPNKIGRDFRLGISEYQGVRDLIMDLYEARTIMAENARLVLKARMVVPASALDAQGNFDASKDTIVAESLDEEMAGKNNGPYTVLEYTFRSGELIAHKNELTLDIMARCGLAEQFSQQSRGGGGQAFTGTALRTRLVPTLQAAEGKASIIDREVPTMLKALAMLSSLDTAEGGCGQTWSNADGNHDYQRSELLPEDQNEKVQRHVMAVQGEIESIQTAVEDMHGNEWADDRIELEVERIRSDRSSGPTYAQDLDDLEEDGEENEPPPPLPPGAQGGTDIPNVPPGGPGSAVPMPSDVVGSRQPGVGPDGQSPGRQPPRVVAGGPK